MTAVVVLALWCVLSVWTAVGWHLAHVVARSRRPLDSEEPPPTPGNQGERGLSPTGSGSS